MRHPYFYLLFSVFLSLYTALNTYIFIHGFRMTSAFGINKIIFTVTFVFFCFAYIVGELTQQKRSSLFSDILITIGSLWFVGMVHFFFVSIGFDIFKLINIGTHWVDRSGMQQIAYNTTWVTLIATLIFLCIGYINARTPAIHRHKLSLKKKNRVQKSITIAVASDIHLSPINGAVYIERIVRKINNLNPDLILLPGDILDGEVDPVIRRDLGKYLKKFQAKYGIYGITGNHEYIGGIDRAAKYIEEHGITLLRDEFISVAGITLIGREDLASARFGHTRKELGEILRDVDAKSALILMDHQPKKLSEAQKAGIDIQLSGHTHNGQLFPLNFIVKRLFEVAQGYKKKGNTHIFVSPGVGTWGPPVRTNTRPEILFLEVEFN